MGGTAGTAILANVTTAVDPGVGTQAAKATIVDLVGVNSNVWEGASKAAAMSNTTSASRSATGADTDVNGADFTSGAPTPVNSAGQGPRTPVDRGELPIAQVQGTGSASPLAGDIATVRGVVTAAYPTGGLGGFFLQTGGTGGATDATPGASDGIYVFAPNLTTATMPAVGASVTAKGLVAEFNGLTEITASNPTSAGQVQVATVAALDPVTALAAALPADADREAHESELLAPSGTFTVSNTYSTNQYAEIGLAAGSTPLISPTEVGAVGSPEYLAQIQDNADRGVTLDDAASLSFLSSANQATPLPWLSQDNPIRVGATATLQAPVVLDYRNNTWKLQPQQQVTGSGSDVATFTNTRSANAAPQSVGGDILLGTFNVLNYFNTTGQVFESRGGSCTYYYDRDGDPVTVNSCSPNGPRGAAEGGDLSRQQAKIVRAINLMDADIVSLEEIENSVKLIGETDRDDAVRQLVNALNAAAGSRRWSFVPSPPASELPTLAEQDVIRNAFIYDPAVVTRVGASKVLVNPSSTAPFNNAREPLAQAFKPKGLGDDAAFAVVVNHFKSKGCGSETGDNVNGPQGCFNGDRRRQAAALTTFADQFAADRGIEAVFLTGDLNSYSQEDPIRDLAAAGYTAVAPEDTAGEYTYSFSGQSGSLDHVLANAAGQALVTGADIWEINANESVAFQYSRINYNVTRFFNINDPFAASDHNPEVVGLTATTSGVAEVQLLGANDYHGRLLRNGAEGGAAILSGAVKQLRSENPNTVFMAAGDLIGASTFESFVAHDEPTIDVLNEAGLEVSSVGNHEFDQGYEDLAGRVQDRADWEYLAANVDEPTGRDDLTESWTKDMNGVTVGFVGAVTEHLDELVSPAGMEGVTVTDIVTATNDEADRLKTEEGADVVVLLVHEGAPTTDCDAMDDDPTSDFGSIITGVNDNVDAIMSGHTHLAYDCSFPVTGWAAAGRDVTRRPVVSSGQYGSNLNRIAFQVDKTSGELLSLQQEILPLIGPDPDGSGPAVGTPLYPADPAAQAIVDDAVREAEVLGARKLGEIGGAFNRAKLSNGTTENRGGESTLGNLVAEIQRWATQTPEAGAAQIAFMNPGGLRADLTGSGTTFPRTVTYRQAATVQPFANTLVNMDLTGEQIEEVLEEQWQAAGASRPFLRLGISEGFTYTYTPPAAGSPAGTKGEVTSMRLDGEPIADEDVFSVTVNSFLASGGDGFTTLNEGADKQDTGKTDLQAQVDYFAAFAASTPLAVDFSQRSVGVRFPAGAPETYLPGDGVQFDVSSFSMTGPGDVKDSTVEVTLDGEDLGSFPVTTTIQSAVPGYDEAGTAQVDVTLPASLEAGDYALLLTGAATGTEVEVPITVAAAGPIVSTVEAAASPTTVETHKEGTTVSVTVTAPGATPTGEVQVLDGATVVGAGTLDDAGRATIATDELRGVRTHTLTVRYAGDENVAASESTVPVEVVKQTPSLLIRSPESVRRGVQPAIGVRLVGVGLTPGGTVTVTWAGRTYTRRLDDDGRAELRVAARRATGSFPLTVDYQGTPAFTTASRTVQIRVTR